MTGGAEEMGGAEMTERAGVTERAGPTKGVAESGPTRTDGAPAASFSASAKAPLIGRGIERAVAEILRAERAPDQDERGAFHQGLLQRGGQPRQRCADDALVRPTRAVDDGRRTVRTIERRQF